MFGMSMSCALRMTVAQVLTHRTRVVEFMCAPYDGKWVGVPGFLSVRQIADGAELKPAQVRRVLRGRGFESTTFGRRRAWRVAAQ